MAYVLELWQKDMRLIKALALEVGAPTPLLDATIPLYLAAIEEGHGQMDTAAVRLALPLKLPVPPASKLAMSFNCCIRPVATSDAVTP